MKHLRQYIRGLILESTRVDKLLSGVGYGIVIEDGTPIPSKSNTKHLMIFNISKFYEAWQKKLKYFDAKEEDIWDIFEESLLESGAAMVGYQRSNNTVSGGRHQGLQTGPCYGGFEIKRIASIERGFSWPLRSIVLSIAAAEGTGFFSDRESVTKAAQAGYEKSMGGYSKLKFDNVLDPKTPDPNDDCLLYGDEDPSADALDYLYYSAGGMPDYFQQLKANTEIFASELPKLIPKRLKRSQSKKISTEKILRWLNKEGYQVALDVFGEVY
tara:strand:- start:392 stop:1201 length:810 start_codon:yes stop_codon:yes gene_type:complete